jgi:hypothetical protein
MVSKLGFQANPDDRDAVRAEIKKALAAVHPDRNGDVFRGEQQEDSYHLLTEALEYVDSDRQLARISPSDLRVFAEVVKQALQPSAQVRRESIRAEFKERMRSEARSQFLAPKIGSGVFAAICAALAAFSGSLKDNPVFGPFFGTTLGVMTLLTLFTYSGMLFLMAWLGERRQAARAEWLASDEAIRKTFGKAIQTAHLDASTFGDVRWLLPGGFGPGESREEPSISHAGFPVQPAQVQFERCGD